MRNYNQENDITLSVYCGLYNSTIQEEEKEKNSNECIDV